MRLAGSRHVVCLVGVTKRFHRPAWPFLGRPAALPALDDVSFSIEEGDICGLVGESGSGKSTLARVILRLSPLTAGAVYFQDIDVHAATRSQLDQIRRQAQIIFQDPYSSLNPSFTVEDILWEGLRRTTGGNRSDARQRMTDLLDLVGLPHDFLRRLPRQLSGGQRQRVGIARALSVSPRFIIADEPTSALDVSIQTQILNLFIDLQQELGLTYLFISHDLRVVRYMCNRLAVMYRGQIVELGSTRAVLDHPSHPYTYNLLASLPEFGRRMQIGAAPREEPQGEVEAQLARGCRFRYRCPLAVARCSEEAPRLRAWIDGRLVRCHRAGEIASTLLTKTDL